MCSSNIDSTSFFTLVPASLEYYIGLHAQVISSARVPLIKCAATDGTSVDIVFASVESDHPPTEEELRDDGFLLKVSAENRLSANGIRTVLEIRHALPVPMHQYSTVLKALKVWAMRREIYGNLFTYPNGVVLAIMTAHLCQRAAPTATTVWAIFLHFFDFYHQWLNRQDHRLPICITASMLPRETVPQRLAGLPPCWSWQKAACQDDLLPVLNPAYPFVNAAHSVGRCGVTHFFREVERVVERCRTVGPTTSTDAEQAAALLAYVWAPYRLVEDYDMVLALHVRCVAMTRVACETAFEAWKGLAESKLRYLIYALECSMEVRPMTRSVPVAEDIPAEGGHQRECCYLMGVRAAGGLPSEEVLQEHLKPFLFMVCSNAGTFERDCQTMKLPWLTRHRTQDPWLQAVLGVTGRK